MRHFKKKIAMTLAFVMLFVYQVPVFATITKASGVTGQIAVTIQFGYEVDKNFEAQLNVTGTKDVTVPISLTNTSDSTAEVVPSIGNGNDKVVVTVKNLPVGNYNLELTSPNHKAYSTQVNLNLTNKHVLVSTNGGSFTVGDLNSDGKVNSDDVQVVEENLNTNNNNYDLNGDGKIDIVELSQTHWGTTAKEDDKLINTEFIVGQVIDTVKAETDITTQNPGFTVTAGSSDMFDSENTNTIKFETKTPISETNPITIPVPLQKDVKEINVSQVVIKAPEGTGPEGGFVVYEDTDGKTVEVGFGTQEGKTKTYTGTTTETTTGTTTETTTGATTETTTSVSIASLGVGSLVEAISNARGVVRDGQKVITINLGNQVPVQKITIKVTDTKDGLLASITNIEFLEDIVEDSINQEKGIIKNFKGAPEDKTVMLSWNELPNVTGYEVSYGTSTGNYEFKSNPSKASVDVSGLENGTEYFFTVRGVNGEWKGPISNEIMIIPEAQDIPVPPTNVQLASLDSRLKVTFRVDETSKSSNIYYRLKGQGDYTKIQSARSGYIISGLKNGETYEVYVTATNDTGESPKSAIVEAAPIKEVIIPPNVPVHQEITDKITKIELLNPGNINDKFYENGFDIAYLTDKNFETHYTAKTYQGQRGVRVQFDKPYKMDYVAYVPRLDTDFDRAGGVRKYYQNAHQYSLKIWSSETDKTPTEILRRIIPIKAPNGLMILPFPAMDVYKIEVALYEWNGAGVSTISEIMFYEYDDLIENITSLFANGSFTELATGVTEIQIDDLLTELDNVSKTSYLMVDAEILKRELLLAKDLVKGVTSTHLGNVSQVEQDIIWANDANKQLAFSLSEVQPLGIVANAGDELVIYVDADETMGIPQIVFSQIYSTQSWQQTIDLTVGRNVIQVPRVIDYNVEKGGSVYIKYNGAKQTSPITVQVSGGKDIPMLDLTNMPTDEAIVKAKVREYVEAINLYTNINNSLSRNSVANSTEIALPEMVFSVPVLAVETAITRGGVGIDEQVDRLYNAVLTWNANMQLHYKMLGFTNDLNEKDIHKIPTSRINTRYMPTNPGVFMYASGDHIGVPYGVIEGLFSDTVDSPNGYFGWGMNHEIGHIINNSRYVVVEATNNLFALYSETVNGGTTRLERGNVYEEMYQKIVSGDTGLAGNVFITLGMFWQLHLALDNDPDNITEFYYNLNRAYREDTVQNESKWDKFARIASTVSDINLTEFMTVWGLNPSQTVKDAMKLLPEPTGKIQYINDEAYRYRLNGGASVADTTTVSVNAQVLPTQPETMETEKSDDIVVKLTMPTLTTGMLGYEIYRDNVLIGFTSKSEYIDQTVVNNSAYTYSVIGYDNLLKPTAKASSNEVKINVDKPIDKTNFTVKNENDSVVIDMAQANEVVGLRFNSDKLNDSLTHNVEVSQDGINYTLAKKDLTLTQGVTYFNKPKAEPNDMRIWTYDAQYIRITGLASLDLADIDVLAYPGDSISFNDDSIGRLEKDFLYNGGKIPAGTLVVMGTYRGHPVYSKIILSAEYVNSKQYKPEYQDDVTEVAVDGEMFLFAEIPVDGEVSKINDGIWLFVPANQPVAGEDENHNHGNEVILNTLPEKIKANMFRTDEATSTAGGRLVSDTIWKIVPDETSLPKIRLN